MKNYKKYIDAFIREKAGRSQDTPPAHVWESLDKQLDGLVPSKPTFFYRWMIHFAIILVVVLFSVPMVKKMFGNTDTSQIAQTINTAPNTQTNVNVTGAALAKQGNTNATGEISSQTTAPIATNYEKTSIVNAPAKGDKGSTEQQQSANMSSTHNAGAVGMTARDNKGHTGKTEKEEIADGKGNDKNTAAKSRQMQNAELARRNKKGNNRTNQPAPVPAMNNYKSAAPDESGSPSSEAMVTNKQTQSTPGITGKENAGTSGKEADKLVVQPQAAKEPLAEKKPASVKTTKESTKSIAQKEPKHVSKPARRLEEGIKAGYESGTSSSAARKYVVSPYLQYNITAKVSVLVQPAAKYAQLTSKNVGTPQSYYKVNDDGAVVQDGNSSVAGSGSNAIYTTNYTYSQTHDSIVKSYAVRGAYMELELPILLKYYIAKKLSVFGGVNFIYNKLPGISENTYTQHGIVESVDFTKVTQYVPSGLPAGPDVAYSGTPFSTYKGPLYPASPGAQLHIGYMAGVSYEYNKRWLVDALVQQSPVSQNVISGYNVNAPLSSLYFRLSVGYRLQHNLHPFKSKDDTGRGD